MPTTVTPVASNDINIVPRPNDGEGVTGASVAAVAQPLANTCAFINARLAAGALKIRDAASIAAMAALTGMADGEHCAVPGYGLYRFTQGLVLTAQSPYLIAAGAPGGMWVLSGYTSFPTLVGGKVVEPVPNRFVKGARIGGVGLGTAESINSAVYVGTSSIGTYIDVSGIVTGDLVFAFCRFGLAIAAAGTGEAFARMQFVDDFAGVATGTAYDETLSQSSALPTGAGVAQSIFAHQIMHTAVATGTTRVRLQVKGDGTTASWVRGPTEWTVQVFRP